MAENEGGSKKEDPSIPKFLVKIEREMRAKIEEQEEIIKSLEIYKSKKDKVLNDLIVENGKLKAIVKGLKAEIYLGEYFPKSFTEDH